MQACKCRGHDGTAVELVKLLVEEHKVEIHTKDRYHSTPLMYAVMDGHKDVVEYLIDTCKLDVNVFDARGMDGVEPFRRLSLVALSLLGAK
jgi:ankyrin repeat protein